VTPLIPSAAASQASISEPSFVPNPNTRQVNLEHILPQKRSQAWPEYSEDQVRSYTHLLSNLALTRKGVNTQLRAASFADKVKRYATEQFVLTREIAGSPRRTAGCAAEARVSCVSPSEGGRFTGIQEGRPWQSCFRR